MLSLTHQFQKVWEGSKKEQALGFYGFYDSRVHLLEGTTNSSSLPTSCLQAPTPTRLTPPPLAPLVCPLLHPELTDSKEPGGPWKQERRQVKGRSHQQ